MIKVSKNIFELKNKEICYIIAVNEYGYLENLYFGKRIDYMPFVKNRRILRGHGVSIAGEKDRAADAGNVNFEYSTSNRGDFRTPAFEAELEMDGSSCFDLKYLSHRIVEKDFDSVLPKCDGGETLEITLSDQNTGLKVQLLYTVYDDINAIVRSAKIVNITEDTLYLNRAYSLNLDMQNEKYYITSLVGAHLRERNIETTRLTHGVHMLDSKRGESSSVINPFVALSEEGADENVGNVYGFNLIYSGNFELNIELDEFDSVRINGGISSFGFRWKLKTGESFETPECVMVFSDGGFNKMSQTFHDLYREHLINKNFAHKERPIVINNWEATYFGFDERKLKVIIDSIKGTGIDTFVLDDGWFGKRNDDTTSLGDWFVNKQKLPNGIKAISDYCHKNGLKFGLWFEPEMISPGSELYRKHPEWVVKAPNAAICLGRDQCVLDLSNREVTDFIIETLSSHIECDRLDYIKWDNNRPITENYSSALPKDRQKEFNHRYILGLYTTLKTITEKYPHVLIEGCASGGCRFDAGILRYCPQIWTSDNTDAFSRMIIQRGTSMCYPLSAISNHVSVCPNHQTGRITPWKARFDTASFGVLGYELNTAKLSADEMSAVRENNAHYLEDRKLIYNGNFYRLQSCDDSILSDLIVSKDKKEAVLRMFCKKKIPNNVIKPIKLMGLQKKSVYRIRETGEMASGEILMNRGFAPPDSKYDFDSFIYHLYDDEQ